MQVTGVPRRSRPLGSERTMPFLTANITSETEGLAVFARQQIHQLATTLQGLDHDQLSSTPTVSAFSLGALARHVLDVADGFTQDILDARSAAAAGGTAPQEGGGPVAAVDEGRDGEEIAAHSGGGGGVLLPSDTAESLIDALEAAGARLAAAIEDGALDTPVPTPPAPWFSGEERWTVRWVALHCIEEVARHAGHADILRESIDGQFAYALNARADGQPWPPEEW